MKKRSRLLNCALIISQISINIREEDYILLPSFFYRQNYKRGKYGKSDFKTKGTVEI